MQDQATAASAEDEVTENAVETPPPAGDNTRDDGKGHAKDEAKNDATDEAKDEAKDDTRSASEKADADGNGGQPQRGRRGRNRNGKRNDGNGGAGPDSAPRGEPMNLTDLKTKTTPELVEIASSIGLENMARSR
jgi:transcription termination factor Rho